MPPIGKEFSTYKKIVVTGGAGFIGSALVRALVSKYNCTVLNIDKLTYAGNQANLRSLENSTSYQFLQADICDAQTIAQACNEFKPDALIHLAAESHVDRSIDGPAQFIQTNIVGTFQLLEVARRYWMELPTSRANRFRFIHVSTDEVYGELSGDDPAFVESSAYQPNSPYAATKASSDHFAKSWQRTYGLPTILTNCSNNYGPFQFPEKLIPLMIIRALQGGTLPVYGEGLQIRDWLHVDDHVAALVEVLHRGRIGHTYNIGGDNERRNIDLVLEICALLDELVPNKRASGLDSYQDLIAYVNDRPGHDFRYAIDATKVRTELNWTPQHTGRTGLENTVAWYLENQDWWQAILDDTYRLQRLGEKV